MLDCAQILRQQAANGSFLNSPSSTAFIYMQTCDPRCLDYIRNLLDEFRDCVPVNYPIDIFERLWVLNNIYHLGLEHYFQDEIQPHLDYVLEHLQPYGVPWSRYVQTPDID